MKFFVAGTPKPAGSKRGFVTKTGKVAMVDSSGQKGKDQRHDIRCAAQDAMVGNVPTLDAVTVIVSFYFQRPKCHFYSGKNAGMLRLDAPRFHTKKPDSDKLVRQVLDGMTGIVYRDDSQVVQLVVWKGYVKHEEFAEGTSIEVVKHEIG